MNFAKRSLPTRQYLLYPALLGHHGSYPTGTRSIQTLPRSRCLWLPNCSTPIHSFLQYVYDIQDAPQPSGQFRCRGTDYQGTEAAQGSKYQIRPLFHCRYVHLDCCFGAWMEGLNPFDHLFDLRKFLAACLGGIFTGIALEIMLRKRMKRQKT